MHTFYPVPNPKTYVAPKKLFTNNRLNGQYLFNKGIMSPFVQQGSNIVCPLDIDTEYWQPTWNDYLKNKDMIELSYKGKNYQLKLPNFWKKGRQGITTQVKGIHQEQGMILAHQDLKLVAATLGEQIRHPIASSGFHPVDYLQNLGIPISIKNVGKIIKTYKGEKLPVFEFVLYAYFALAEWNMIADDDFKKDLENLTLRSNGHHIEMRKRLKTVFSYKNIISDSVDVPWLVTIDGMPFRVKIAMIDPCGMHGVASYNDFCEACNIKLPYKKLMDEYKPIMHLGYFEKPKEFDLYSLGDLHNYQGVESNADLFKEIWKNLDIEEYYKVPDLTIGKTVSQIFEAKIFKLFNVPPDNKKAQKELLEKVCYKATASHLKELTHSTACLNAKVNGGRCRNNRPNLVVLEGVILDIDYDGCYGEGQRNQLYPFGNPITESFLADSKINQYPTLRQWLKDRKWGKANCELVPGLWEIRVCTKEIWNGSEKVFDTLEIHQDVLESWFDFKFSDVKNMKTDSDKEGYAGDYLEVKTGETKIFNIQVIYSFVGHDYIQWLENIASPQQKNELLDNLYVHTSIYYPSYDRVDSPQELLERINNHKGKNTVKSGKRRKGSYFYQRSEECTAWYGVNLGEFIIDNFLAWRKMYPKKNSDNTKNALNTLYKLNTNVLFGVNVSPHFRISNVVVGNNITARARMACWYAEKGFYGCQPITDGVAFNINTVVYPLKNRRVTAQSVVNLHREDNPGKRQIRLAPLGGYKKIELEWLGLTDKNNNPKLDQDEKQIHYPILKLTSEDKTAILKPEFINDKWTNPAMDWANKTALEHLQNIFSKVDILHKITTKIKSTKGEDGKPIIEYIEKRGQFQFEAKSFYDRGVFHGSANYYLQGKGGNSLAMRSYEKKKHETPIMSDNDKRTIAFTVNYHENEKITPAELFMKALDNPTSVERAKPFIKNGILKINEARKNQERWKAVGRLAGDTIQKSGLLREFSPSQFTFLDLKQYKSICREINYNKRHYSQTYEGYFINEDGTLDFEKMVKDIDLAIAEGCLSLNQKFDKSRNRHRDEDIKHPQKELLEIMREILLQPDKIEELEDDWFDDVKNVALLSDESGTLYVIDGDYDPTESMELEDESLLDDIDFGW